jgi:hypothetical protein
MNIVPFTTSILKVEPRPYSLATPLAAMPAARANIGLF